MQNLYFIGHHQESEKIRKGENVCKSYLSAKGLISRTYKELSKKDTYLFSILGYHAILLYFVVQIVPDLATEGSFCWFLCLFDILSLLHAYLHVCFFLSIPLLSGARRYSRFILCISWPNPRISYFSKELWVVFYWKMVLETQICVHRLLLTRIFIIKMDCLQISYS